MTVGFLHPGAMGASIAGVCDAEGLWVSEGRSEDTRARAVEAGLTAVGSLAELVDVADVIVSVCPPGSAAEVAGEVADAGFDGLYVDVNAIAPSTARAIGARFERFVDGGIIGPPVTTPGLTRLYLAGPEAGPVADLWRDSPLEVRLVEGLPGAASAVKGCFATWTKASAAMLLAVRARSRAEGVESALLQEWETSMPELAGRSELTAVGTAPKAWRFVDEMREHAAAFEAAGLPGGFGDAASEIYRRMAGLKHADGAHLAEVLRAIRMEDQ